MGRSLFRPAKGKMTEDWSKRNTFFHESSGRYYTMIERDGKFFQRRHQKGFDGADANILEKQVEYVIGSGNHARSFLGRDAGGALVEFPVSWYSENGGYWAMSPGYDRPDHQDFRRAIQADCLSCHNAYPRSVSGSNALPEGIDCQRCHGPGEAHVSAAGQTNPDLAKVRDAIVNPKRLNRDRQLEVCMQCHLETTSSPLPHMVKRPGRPDFSYKPGEKLGDFATFFDHQSGSGHDDKFEIAHAAYRLRKSACFEASEMTCTTCHNPHNVPRGADAVAHYVAACQNCHATPHENTKVTIGSNTCLDCHMPKRRTDDAVHVVMTDHFIQRRKPAGNLVAPRAEHSTSASYKGRVMQYYPQNQPTDEIVYAMAQVQHGSNLAEGIPLLRSAIEKQQPKQPDPYFELGRAYRKNNQDQEAVAWLQRALTLDTSSKAVVNELAAALLALKRDAEALTLLEKHSANDATALTNLANVYLRQGKIDAAQSAIVRAMNANPDQPDAHQTAGLIATQRRDGTAAEQHLREAIRIQPDLPEAQHNLGRLLAEKGSYREAEYHLARAVSANPSYAEARHTHGLVFLVLRENDRALAEFQEAVRLAPHMAQARNDLADVLAAKGRLADAVREYEEALRLNPAIYEAHLSLGSILGRQGATARARQHLTRASESPDPDVRRAAASALGLTPR